MRVTGFLILSEACGVPPPHVLAVLFLSRPLIARLRRIRCVTETGPVRLQYQQLQGERERRRANEESKRD